MHAQSVGPERSPARFPDKHPLSLCLSAHSQRAQSELSLRLARLLPGLGVGRKGGG